MERAAEVAAHVHLEQFKRSVEGKPRLGVEIFGKALLVVPKTLLENSGMDVQDGNMRGKGEAATNFTVGTVFCTGYTNVTKLS